MNMFKKNGGFTLVELIVVIAILAILAGVAVPAYSGYIKSANEAADVTALGAVKTAAMATYAKEGSVTQITVTDKDNTTANSVTVWLNGATDADDGKATAAVADFLSYYNATSFNIDLKTGTTATWTSTTGKWAIAE